jgi:ubiquinone/menaquinone biosynthesis C-methylase UbiE
MSWALSRWDFYAPFYDSLISFLPVRRRSIELAQLRPGERVLVDGCGTGLDLPLLPAGVEVTAVDLSSKMIELARAKATPARLARMDAQRLALPDATFDCVVLHLIVAIVPDPLACLREASRVLKPGGRIIFFDKFYHGQGKPRLIRRLLNPLMRFLGTQLNLPLYELVQAAGLRAVHEEPAMLNGMFRLVTLRK